MTITKDQLQLGAAASGLLHRIFLTAPEEATLMEIRRLLPHWPGFGGDNEWATTTILESLENNTLAELREDYHALFLGPGPMLAYPWGSVYTDKERLLFGDTTMAFRAFCRRLGVAFELESNEPEDHIALMLAVMSRLFDASANGQEHLNALTELLETHMLNWVPQLLDAVDNHAQTGYFRGFGELLRQLLQDWRQLLAEEITGQ